MDRSFNADLKHLHHLHLQLQEIQGQLDRGPKQIKARQQFAQQKQDELDAQKLKHKQLRMAADQKSLQLRSNEAKIADLRGKLNACSSNREFDIIRGQIDADTMANSVLEDEILDTLEQVDAAQVASRKLEAEVAAARQEEERVAHDIVSAQSNLADRAQSLAAQILEAERILPPEISIPYRRLVLAHGAGAMASVEGNICSSCYVNIPSQMAVILRAGRLLFCKTCGRLLYTSDTSGAR